jgi:hypothetical protein
MRAQANEAIRDHAPRIYGPLFAKTAFDEPEETFMYPFSAKYSPPH